LAQPDSTSEMIVDLAEGVFACGPALGEVLSQDWNKYFAFPYQSSEALREYYRAAGRAVSGNQGEYWCCGTGYRHLPPGLPIPTLTAVPSRASVPAAGPWVFTSPNVLAGDVDDLADPAEHEARRLQRGSGLGLGVTDHARDGGRVVLTEGEAAVIAKRDLAHVAQVDVLDREGLVTPGPAGAQLKAFIRAPGEQRAVGAQGLA